MGKAICLVTCSDASVVCGSDQLYAGLQCGIEGAIYAMNELFDPNHLNSSGWGVLLVDASNAFNSLNRISMLLHVHQLWPRCACFVFNTYRGWPVLVMRGMSDFILSKEGVTPFVYVCLCNWYFAFDTDSAIPSVLDSAVVR